MYLLITLLSKLLFNRSSQGGICVIRHFLFLFVLSLLISCYSYLCVFYSKLMARKKLLFEIITILLDEGNSLPTYCCMFHYNYLTSINLYSYLIFSVFSSPEHKVLKVSFCDGPLSVVHRPCVRPCVRASTIS